MFPIPFHLAHAAARDPHSLHGLLIRGAILNRAYGTNKTPYTSVFLPTIFGPINYDLPQYGRIVAHTSWVGHVL